MSKFFEQIKEGLEEVLAHKEGKITLRSEIIEIPEPPISYTASSIKKIRAKGNYSQIRIRHLENLKSQRFD